MSNLDLFNLTLLESEEEVDQINKRFYGKYSYPWPPSMLQAYPNNIAASLLNQDIGVWDHSRISPGSKIWVAGCGTNQALLTALKFPQAEVYGTDISTQSLAACRQKAMQINVQNLKLEEKSLNDVDYNERFDYIICTGVVHHNANPEAVLRRISRALKKNGILEFMVYNYYYRLLTVATQRAVRAFYDQSSSPDIELEVKLIRHLISDFQYDNLMTEFLQSHAGMHEAEMTDALIQPLEYSYTVESLDKLTGNCNLEILSHCLNQFDVNNNAFTWNLDFKDEYLHDYYNSLPDLKRWQISNLLMFNKSPFLWFYLQRTDADHERKTEQELCAGFLETKFSRNSFVVKNYFLDAAGKYESGTRTARLPSEDNLNDEAAERILNAIEPGSKIKDICRQLDLHLDFYALNNVRIKLTTSGYPYLLAVES
jgi:ubiquinone/menaquinone biosynthesis C-methylase UbiE